MLGGLCRGKVKIENLSPGQDVQSTLTCLRSLGVKVRQEGNVVKIEGHGLHGLQKSETILDAGNSGTTMRLLAGMLSGQSFETKITGDASLQKRDMKRIVEPLSQMGAKISSNQGFAPLWIHGGNLHGIEYTMPIASSQVKSSILLAGLFASGVTSVIEHAPTRDHTERMFRYLGIKLDGDKNRVTVPGGQEPQARDFSIPGDFSSAAFLIAAALLMKEAHLVIQDVGMNRTRTRFLDILAQMGGQIALKNERLENEEPRADLEIHHSDLKGIEVSGVDIPLLIDELPILAILASQAHGVTLIRDAKELRVKESDRIQATVTNLKAMGGNIEELPDGMRIEGPTRLDGASLRSFHDHRIIMAFAVAGLVASGETILEETEWADISFPGFFEMLGTLSHT